MKLTIFRNIIHIILLYFIYYETGVATTILLTMILILIESITFQYRQAKAKGN